MLKVEAIVPEKLHAVSRADQQKILRYLTKYAFFSRIIYSVEPLPRLQKNPWGDGPKFDTAL